MPKLKMLSRAAVQAAQAVARAKKSEKFITDLGLEHGTKEITRNVSRDWLEASKVPAKEFKRIDKFDIIPIPQEGEYTTQARYRYRESSRGRSQTPGEIIWSKIEVDPVFSKRGSVFHEFGHARMYKPVLGDYLTLSELERKEALSSTMFLDLSEGVEYIKKPVEQHARRFEELILKVPPSRYEEAYQATMKMLTRRLLKDKKAKNWLLDNGLEPSDLLIGALAAMAAKEVFTPEEAEAGIGSLFRKIGKMSKKIDNFLFSPKSKPKEFVPVGRKKIKIREDESRGKDLIGYKHLGKTITDVQKGRGDTRVIFFEDGTQKIVNKKYIHDLAQDYGAVDYATKFTGRSRQGQLEQALESLRRNQKFGVPLSKIKKTRRHFTSHIKRLEELGEATRSGQVIVEWNGKYFNMMTPYAELLEEEGIVRIIERLR